MKNLLFSLLLTLLISESSSAQQSADIQVEISIDSSSYTSCRHITVNAELVNNGDHIKHIFPDLLESSVLALTVFNTHGERVPSIPPPTPRNEPFIKIEPKDKLQFTYHLNIFSPELPKGEYFVKMSQFSSNKVRFTIE